MLGLFFRRIVIPRPGQTESTHSTTGVGKVFVKYKQLPGAAAAVQSLSDRTFAGKKVGFTLFHSVQRWVGVAVIVTFLLRNNLELTTTTSNNQQTPPVSLNFLLLTYPPLHATFVSIQVIAHFYSEELFDENKCGGDDKMDEEAGEDTAAAVPLVVLDDNPDLD